MTFASAGEPSPRSAATIGCALTMRNCGLSCWLCMSAGTSISMPGAIFSRTGCTAQSAVGIAQRFRLGTPASRRGLPERIARVSNHWAWKKLRRCNYHGSKRPKLKCLGSVSAKAVENLAAEISKRFSEVAIRVLNPSAGQLKVGVFPAVARSTKTVTPCLLSTRNVTTSPFAVCPTHPSVPAPNPSGNG